MMTPEAERELRELRLRAYGPDAVSSLGAQDLARLNELEQRARPVATASPPAPEPRGASTSGAEGVHGADRTSSAEPSLVASTPPSAGPRPWWRRRSVWLAVVVGAVLGTAATVGIGMLRTPPPDLVLPATAKDGFPVTALAGVPGMRFDPESFQHYGPWHDMDLWTVERLDGVTCLLTTDAGEEDGDGGVGGFGCAADGGDPRLDLWVWQGMAELIGADIPTGTSIRFLARDDGVGVWLWEPGAMSEE